MLYELHLTTTPDADIDRWIEACDRIDAKALDIRLLSDTAKHGRQVMFAARTETSTPSSWNSDLRWQMIREGFTILRAKLEVPLDKSAGLSAAYFEAHVKTLAIPNQFEPDIQRVKALGWKASANYLKPTDDGRMKTYFTLRHYESDYLAAGRYFTDALSVLRLALSGYPLRMEMETVLHDTNPELDAGWE